MTRPGLRTFAAAAAVLALAGCGAGAAADAPTWVPAPSFTGEGGGRPSAQPAVPGAPGRTGGSAGSPAPSAPSSSVTAQDPNVVASQLSAPDTIALLPDGTALVGERTTGRILQVQPVPGSPVKVVRVLTGLSTAGGGGLLDLALSPSYSQDNLIFALISTATDVRVVDFTATGVVTPVLTGIPHGAADTAGRLTVGEDGRIYVGTGDAGSPPLAADPASLAGKVLRITDIGTSPADNPSPGSPVWSSGHRLVTGLCSDPTSGLMLAIEPAAAGGADDVEAITAGSTFAWPAGDRATATPIATLPTTYGNPGGCAVGGGQLFVTSLDGQALLAAPLTQRGGTVTVGKFAPYLHNTYGRLLEVVAAPDGALWLTTSNRDGHGRPVPADERVLRILAPSNESNYPG